MRTLLNSLLSTACWLTVCHPFGQPRVQLGDTTLIGKDLQPSKLEFFGGIPFAEPPIDDLRFSPPRPKYSLSPLRSFDARDFGPPCLQPAVSPLTGTPVSAPPESFANMSEDCLNLNVFRPSGVDAGSSLPVMVWIFGGAFQYGASFIYDGTHLVEKSVDRGTPILFVSINYRLGPLGFPQGPEAVERGALNLGLHDQRVALEWVQKNIAAFGGDPRKVTVFGESAGATSISLHYLNDYFSTVARAAIFESGTASTLNSFDADRNLPSWMLFANSVPSCATATPNDTFSCLLSASESDILAALNSGYALNPFPFLPVFDGPAGVLSDYPAKRLSRGAGSRAPVLAGTNLDEGTLFTSPDFQTEDISIWLNVNATPSPVGPDALKAGMDKVMSLYPDDPSAGSPFDTGSETFGTGSGYKREAAIFGDLRFQAQRRFWTQTTRAPSYAYLFTDPQPGANPALGVLHTSELPYIFGSLSTTAPPKVANLSSMMLDYWISFAVSLTPNDGKGASRPYWETYEKTKEILELNSDSVSMIPDNYRAAAIDAIIQLRDELSW